MNVYYIVGRGLMEARIVIQHVPRQKVYPLFLTYIKANLTMTQYYILLGFFIAVLFSVLAVLFAWLVEILSYLDLLPIT